MISKPDPIKSRLVLHYLGRATKNYTDRETARKKLSAQLKQLKKISTNTLQKHLQELEKRIVDTVAIENKILKAQHKEDNFHRNLHSKIDVLGQKLGRYVDTKEAREKRIKELEEKMSDKGLKKNAAMLDLKESIQKLEGIYSEALKSKQYSKKDLGRIRKRINLLKDKLKIVVVD